MGDGRLGGREGLVFRGRLYFDDVVGSGLFLSGGADSDVASLGPERGQIAGPEVAHAALEAADEVGQHVVGAA